LAVAQIGQAAWTPSRHNALKRVRELYLLGGRLTPRMQTDPLLMNRGVRLRQGAGGGRRAPLPGSVKNAAPSTTRRRRPATTSREFQTFVRVVCGAADENPARGAAAAEGSTNNPPPTLVAASMAELLMSPCERFEDRYRSALGSS
jgi:hypothetical protein